MLPSYDSCSTKTSKCAAPEFATLEARLKTFDSWPMPMPQRPKQLAGAGFFYTGLGDKLKCFSCGGALSQWEPNDDPWEQHAKWFQECGFVLRQKGAWLAAQMTGSTSALLTITQEEVDGINYVKTTKLILADKTFAEGEKVSENATSVSKGAVLNFSTLMYKREDERLKSFQDWPVTFLPASLMSAAGFYYTNKNDIVRCPFCDVTLSCWEPGDDPVEEHKEHSPNCDFINGLPCGDVPLFGLAKKRDKPTYYGMEIRQSSDDVEKGLMSLNLDALNVLTTNTCAVPIYSSLESRLKTFESWPVSMPQKPNELASAGFYYTGLGDKTNCFHCGGGLSHWEPQDDPWEEHAKWLSDCSFVLIQKGSEYVAQAKSSIKTDRKTQDDVSCDTGILEQEQTAAPQVEEVKLCKVCYGCERTVVFLPCRHLVSCGQCAWACPQCPLCRQDIIAIVRVFMS